MIKYFSKTLRSERLVLKHLEPNTENAKILFTALKNEKPKDYEYEPLVDKHVVPQSVSETLKLMKLYSEWAKQNGSVFYMFCNNQFIGVRRLFFFKEANTLKFASIWLVKSARGHGFATESFRLLEDIAFNKLKANKIMRVNIVDNKESANLAKRTDFILDGVSRQAVYMNGKFYDLMIWSKLRTDYTQEKNKSKK